MRILELRKKPLNYSVFEHKKRKERKATIKQNQNIYKLFRFPTFDDLLNKCRELHFKRLLPKRKLSRRTC